MNRHPIAQALIDAAAILAGGLVFVAVVGSVPLAIIVLLFFR